MRYNNCMDGGAAPLPNCHIHRQGVSESTKLGCTSHTLIILCSCSSCAVLCAVRKLIEAPYFTHLSHISKRCR